MYFAVAATLCVAGSFQEQAGRFWPPLPITNHMEQVMINSESGSRSPGRHTKNWWPAATMALCLGAASFGSQAQSIVMAGSYQNFDVLNNTGQPTYGFE